MRAAGAGTGDLRGRRVLVLEDRTTHTAAAGAASLVRSGCQVWSGSPSPGLLARSRLSAGWVRVSDPVADLGVFARDVQRAIDEHAIDLVVATSDRDVVALASCGLPACTPTLPSLDVVRGLFDKASLARRTAAVGLCPPRTERVGDAGPSTDWSRAVVKPALHWTGAGHRGGHHAAVVCDSRDEVLGAAATLRAEGADPVVQELVPGPMSCIAMVVDHDGVLRAVGQVDAEVLFRGSTVVARTVSPDADAVARLLRLLGDAGWFGCAQFDLIRDERSGVLRPIDFNGRWFMSMTAIGAAGCDLAARSAAVALSIPLEGCAVAAPGVRFRWPQALLLRGLVERDPRLVARSLFPLPPAVHPYATRGSRCASLRHDARAVARELRRMRLARGEG